MYTKFQIDISKHVQKSPENFSLVGSPGLVWGNMFGEVKLGGADYTVVWEITKHFDKKNSHP